MEILYKALIFFVNIIYPQNCLICGKSANNRILCEKCKKRIINNQLLNIEYKAQKYYFEKHIYLFKYKDEIRKLILDYKFNDKPYFYKIFSENLIKNKKICGILKKYDIIIPVPIHKKRKIVRGYNQSELIARDIAKNIEGLKLETKAIIKVKNNIAQSKLNKKQRKINVKNAYNIINKEKIIGKKIVLFDDIYTTGSTANEISKILKENGAKEVTVLTIAKD